MTLATLLRQHGAALLERHPQPPGVQAVLRRLAACRTAALGGHATRCCQCQQVTYHYHSCGDRHCPQCGGSKRAAWLAKRQAELLPVPYFHVVFTLPHELSALALGNRALLYGLLFDAAAQTLLQVAADPKHLGAKIGVLMVLHTWGQQLEHHPHVHCVVPGGGLSADGARWLPCRPNYFVPVRVLSRVFRGKYLAALRQAHDRGQLQFGGSTRELMEPARFQRFVSELYRKPWVTYAKKPFGGPEQMLRYLTRYTHRVALCNGRLLRQEAGQVTLAYKDYADGCRGKELTLAAPELLRRFCLHVTPSRFVRIRQYGLLAHRDRQARLAHCRQLLTAPSQPPAPEQARPWLLYLLLLVLPVALAPATLLSPSALLSMAGDVAVCSQCGSAELETFWQAPRPNGRQLELDWHWDSS